MANRIGARPKFDLAGIGREKVAVLHPLGQLRQVFFGVAEVQACERAVKKSRNVRVIAMPSFLLERADAVVGPCALAFGGGNQEIVAQGSQGAGIPISRNESKSVLRQWKRDILVSPTPLFENSNCIQRGVGHKKPLAVGRLGQGVGIGSRVFLAGKFVDER